MVTLDYPDLYEFYAICKKDVLSQPFKYLFGLWVVVKLFV
jgi:hypothetical protein